MPSRERLVAAREHRRWSAQTIVCILPGVGSLFSRYLFSRWPSGPSAIEKRRERGRAVITQETSVRKRDGRVVAFDPARISRAVLPTLSGRSRGIPKGSKLHPELREEVERTTAAVTARMVETDESVDVERIQDLVEEQLMRDGNYRVARRYIVYREEHKKARMFRGEPADGDRPAIKVRHDDGSESVFEAWRVRRKIEAACRDLENVDPGRILDDALGSLYDGITPQQVQRATILAARSHIEADPAYGDAAARLLLGVIYREAWGSMPAEGRLREHLPAKVRRLFAGRGRGWTAVLRTCLEFDLGREALHRAAAGTGRRLYLPRVADDLRPVPDRGRRPPHRVSPILLDARRDGPRPERRRPRSAGYRVLRDALGLPRESPPPRPSSTAEPNTPNSLPAT